MAPVKGNLGKVYSCPVQRYVALDSGEKNWWNKLLEPAPEGKRCRNVRCTFAPPGHKSHGCKGRNFSVFERHLIIQYLVHINLIPFAKGRDVWYLMIEDGYLTHRTIESLRGFFAKTLLREIRDYKLPKDLEEEFLALVV